MKKSSAASSSEYDFANHWNKAYQRTPVTNLGWFEEEPAPTIELINQCDLAKDALIFNAGVGATTLIDFLLKKNHTNIVVNDISSSALLELKENLSIPSKANIQFIVDDLTKPSELLKLKDVALWNDRAVLHFFTEEWQQKAYFDLLKKVVKVGGYVILAEFNLEGAKKCCGLDVVNYNDKMLEEQLGSDFKLLKTFNYTYTQPSGNTREYVYTLFSRTA